MQIVATRTSHRDLISYASKRKAWNVKRHYFEKAANSKQCSNSGFALMFVMHVLPVLYRVMGK